jgi:hypothetical protein
MRRNKREEENINNYDEESSNKRDEEKSNKLIEGSYTSIKKSKNKRKEELKYNVGLKLEFQPLFILVLGFF